MTKKKFSLNVGVIVENESDLSTLVTSFSAQGMQTTLIPIGDIVLTVEDGVPKVRYDDVSFDGVDAVFLDVPLNLMLFTEPLLTELSERGIPAQIKPTAVTMLANRPYLHATLNMKGVALPKLTIVRDVGLVESAAEKYGFPLMLETYHGIGRPQRMIVESKSTLTSFLKSVPSCDVLVVREFLQGDLHESVVIGNDVFTTKRVWSKKDMHHAKRKSRTRLTDEDRETVLDATRIVGVDVACVKMINGLVVGVDNEIDFETVGSAVGVNLYDKLAQYYEEKLA